MSLKKIKFDDVRVAYLVAKKDSIIILDDNKGNITITNAVYDLKDFPKVKQYIKDLK